MKVIKKQAKSTYEVVDEKTKEKKVRHYYNYYLQCDNGKRILIKCVNKDDNKRLDMISEYER